MFTRQHLPHAVVDVFFFLLYSGAVLGSFPAVAYSCDAVSLPAFLSVAISVEQVRNRLVLHVSCSMEPDVQ